MAVKFLSKRFITASAFLTASWLLMAGSLNSQEAAIGVLVAIIITGLSYSRLAFLDDFKLSMVLPLYVLQYLAEFLRALLAANIDMARRVITPSLPIDPAVVEVQTKLHSPLGKLLLANSITLTPGTLTIDIEDDIIRVHWIDARGIDDLTQVTHTISERFEKPLSGILR